MKVLHGHITSSVLAVFFSRLVAYHSPDVPEDERHRPSGPCSTNGIVASLVVIPKLAVAIDAASAVAVNANVVASDHEPSGVILEFNVIGVVAPVV